MKKIFIFYSHNTFNYGSAMMVINTIYYLSKLLGAGYSFSVDLLEAIDYERIKAEVGDVPIEPIGMSKQLGVMSNRLLRIKHVLFDESRFILREAPFVVIVLGGDDINENYWKYKKLVELFHFNIITKKSSVFLPGQTIGPFFSWREKLAAQFLKNCHIYPRDPITTRYLKNKMRLRNVWEAHDLAFLDLPRQNDHINLLKDNKLQSDKYVTLVPTGPPDHYTDDKKRYIETWKNIIVHMLNLPEIEGSKIVLLAHVLSRLKRRCDDTIIRNIVDALGERYKQRIVILDKLILPSEARTVLGNGLLTITGRMHAAISTFQMGKPALALAYSVKYAGVIGKGLGRDDLIVEASGNSYWEEGTMLESVRKKIGYVLKTYDVLREEITYAVEEAKKKAAFQIEDMADKIRRV